MVIIISIVGSENIRVCNSNKRKELPGETVVVLYLESDFSL